jgi:hypothetical protein
MSDPQKIAHAQRLLEAIGVSAQDAEVYLRILFSCGQNSSIPLKTPPSSEEASINRLKDSGLLLVGLDEHGARQVVPVDPRLASRAIYSRRLWSICPSWVPITSLPTSDQKLIAALHRACRQVEEALSTIYKPAPRSVGFETVPSAMVSQELAACLQRASKIIRGITVPSWAPDVAIIWESIKERIASGVTYRRLADEATFISFGLWINRRDVLEVGVNLRILPAAALRDKFFLVDDAVAFSFWRPNPKKPFSLEATKTTLDMFVRQFRDSFDTLWEAGLPAEKLFPKMEPIRTNFAKRCRDALIGEPFPNFSEGLVDFGMFFQPPSDAPTPETFNQAIQALRAANLVIQSPDGSERVIPNIVDDLKQIVFQETNRT